jgi:F-type H+-transporting ATPase subunit b
MAEHQENIHSGPGAPAMHAGTAAEGHAPSAGLPQLNVNDFAPQLVWLAITFGLLYLIMSRVALPRIAGVMERRRERIAADVDEAKKLGKQAQDAETAYKTALADAKAKAHSIAQQTRDSLAADVEAKRGDVERQIAAKLQEAEQRIDASKRSAMNEVGAIATATTREIVSHLIGGDVTPDQLSQALKAAGE